MKKAKNLILITDQYPTDEAGDGCFIEDEIAYYACEFERVLILPKTIGSAARSLPLNVIACDSLARAVAMLNRPGLFGITRLIRAFFSVEYREECLRAPGLYGKIKLLYYISKASMCAEIIRREADQKVIDLSETVLYSFWFDGCAYGCALLGPLVWASVARAHGADLYEERHRGNYIPLRARTIKALSLIACVSTAGTDYLRSRYPEDSWKIQLFPLGMKDASKTFDLPQSYEKEYIVSCSSLIPLKRVELIIQGLSKAQDRLPKNIEWVHFGDGSERHMLEAMALDMLKPRSFTFLGNQTRDEILRFYGQNLVKSFITTSRTEGGRPMSIAEALCFGIPVIATAVGGIPDLVTSGNGALLPENPTPEEVSEAIVRIVLDPDSGLKRAAARAVWEDKCSADSITKNFARCLSEGLGVSAAPSPNRPSPD